MSSPNPDPGKENKTSWRKNNLLLPWWGKNTLFWKHTAFLKGELQFLESLDRQFTPHSYTPICRSAAEQSNLACRKHGLHLGMKVLLGKCTGLLTQSGDSSGLHNIFRFGPEWFVFQPICFALRSSISLSICFALPWNWICPSLSSLDLVQIGPNQADLLQSLWFVQCGAQP